MNIVPQGRIECGIIHPACYAYIGALLPLVFALVYLNTCNRHPRFRCGYSPERIHLCPVPDCRRSGPRFHCRHHYLNGTCGDYPLLLQIWHAQRRPLEFCAVCLLILCLYPPLVDRYGRLPCRCPRRNASRLRPADATGHRQHSDAGCRIGSDLFYPCGWRKG